MVQPPATWRLCYPGSEHPAWKQFRMVSQHFISPLATRRSWRLCLSVAAALHKMTTKVAGGGGTATPAEGGGVRAK